VSTAAPEPEPAPGALYSPADDCAVAVEAGALEDACAEGVVLLSWVAKVVGFCWGVLLVVTACWCSTAALGDVEGGMVT